MRVWTHWLLWGTIAGGLAGGWSADFPPLVRGTVWGTTVALSQWGVLRRHWELTPFWGWLFASLLGFWAASFVEMSVLGDGLFGAVIAGLLRGSVMGWLQWRILRFHVVQMRPWILLTALGWSLGAVWLGWGELGPYPAHVLCVATAMAVTGRFLQTRTWLGERFR